MYETCNFLEEDHGLIRVVTKMYNRANQILPAPAFLQGMKAAFKVERDRLRKLGRAD